MVKPMGPDRPRARAFVLWDGSVGGAADSISQSRVLHLQRGKGSGTGGDACIDAVAELGDPAWASAGSADESSIGHTGRRVVFDWRAFA